MSKKATHFKKSKNRNQLIARFIRGNKSLRTSTSLELRVEDSGFFFASLETETLGKKLNLNWTLI